MPATLLLAVLAGPAAAELPPPDYRAALVAAAEAEADALIGAGRLDEADRFVERFREGVTDDARLIYEAGLIRRLAGDPQGALGLLERAVERDPSLAYAWYDLGEVRLQGGDLAGAREAFERASAMSERHPKGWAGPFRLAELAGREGDAIGFERWLKEALRRGFSFRTVLQDPTWRGFLGQPELGDVLRRMATVYGSEEVIDAWEAAGG